MRYSPRKDINEQNALADRTEMTFLIMFHALIFAPFRLVGKRHGALQVPSPAFVYPARDEAVRLPAAYKSVASAALSLALSR
jgi:hypothetical protein